jgi:hypothetical protein
MGAETAYGQSSSAIDLSAEAVGDHIGRALTLLRVLIEANLRTGSAPLAFAGHCVHAETELFEQLAARHDLEQPRGAVARLADAVEPAAAARPAWRGRNP